jgi:hypothetical protein
MLHEVQQFARWLGIGRAIECRVILWRQRCDLQPRDRLTGGRYSVREEEIPPLMRRFTTLTHWNLAPIRR